VPATLTANAIEIAAKMETTLHRDNFKLHLAFACSGVRPLNESSGG
jgi:hypothetical protein